MSMHKKAEVNVLMLGARRAGKTSILASMCEEFDDIYERCGASLSLNQDSQNDKSIDDALNNMRYIFEKYRGYESFSTVNDVQTTEGRRDYSFNLRILNGKNKKSKHSIRFTDLPGEYIAPPDSFSEEIKDQRRSEVQQVYEESDIIIIAIDTVFLMENNGLYNEKYNECSMITRWLKNITETKDERKMILFVPIKYETYYYANEYAKVNNQIHKAYNGLIKFLTRDEFKSKFFVAITPVLTLGDVVFDRFNILPNGNLSALYRFINNTPRYNPQFCEQPLLYILSYVYQLIKYDKNGKKHWFRLGLNIGKDKVFLAELDKAQNARTTNAPFEIIQDSFKK